MKKLFECGEEFILRDFIGTFIFVLIPFLTTGLFITLLIFLEAQSVLTKLIVFWVAGMFLGTVASFKFARWWVIKKYLREKGKEKDKIS